MSEAKSANKKPSGAKQVSLSFRVDSNGVVEHNNRDFVAKNVDRNRIPLNITYKQEDIREMYHKLFDEALAEYNAKQKRADRQIPDYYEHINKSKQEKPYYEAIIQIGDMNDCGQGKQFFEEAKKMLDEYMQDFEKRNPNIKVFNAVMHLDEATPHLHIDFVPVCHKQKRGLPTRVSLKGALAEQGIISKCKKYSEHQMWAESEKKYLREILRNHGFGQLKKGANYSHMTVDEFKNAKKKIEEINQHVNAYKAKPNGTLTPDEIAMIKNQNDFMRGEIQKRDEKIWVLSQRLGSKFVPFDVYSQDKISYICAELSRLNIPFVDESSCIYIPGYAFKTCSAIAAGYTPPKGLGIHAEIALDIDRLIYSSDNFSDLLEKLKSMGYEIKEGKYIAVKSPKAQRFVRLKSLGEEYLPKNIEKRIAERDIFPKAVQQKSAKAGETEQRFYATITQTIIAVRSFRLRPQKSDSKQIYCFENDKAINFLSEQILTMQELNLTSREKIYEAAEEGQAKIAETTKKIKELSDEIPTLNADIAQIKLLFSGIQNSKDTMTQMKYAAAREKAEKYGVKSEEDIESLERRLKLLPMYIQNLKSELSEEQLKQKRISDLVQTYEKIIEGNYIDNLVAAEKEREAREKDKQNTRA